MSSPDPRPEHGSRGASPALDVVEVVAAEAVAPAGRVKAAMPAARSLAPFRSRAFVFVWLGAMVSNIGTWMETTALSFYVAERATASASGLVAAAGFLPGAILGPVGAARWADRFDRRRIMIAANATAGVVAAFVAVLVAPDRATPGNRALCSLVGGCVNASRFPSFQAILPDLVDPEDLVRRSG
ncbi:MAG: MFS transporter [Ilumatobacteraceae bacterium]